jgi:streptothricin acetyltransferase
MPVEIRSVSVDALARFVQIPSIVRVESLLRVVLLDNGLGGMLLHEEKVHPPYIKDYDAYGEGGPEDWPRQFDVRNWGFFLALEGERPVGGAAVAFDTPGVHMLAGRRDLAVLWDIRVHPDRWGCGIGTQVFRHAAEWARRHGARQLKIETQNVNVRACRFYRQQGAKLGEIDRYGYAGHPLVGHEVELVWYLDL